MRRGSRLVTTVFRRVIRGVIRDLNSVINEFKRELRSFEEGGGAMLEMWGLELAPDTECLRAVVGSCRAGCRSSCVGLFWPHCPRCIRWACWSSFPLVLLSVLPLQTTSQLLVSLTAFVACRMAFGTQCTHWGTIPTFVAIF